MEEPRITFTQDQWRRYKEQINQAQAVVSEAQDRRDEALAAEALARRTLREQEATIERQRAAIDGLREQVQRQAEIIRGYEEALEPTGAVTAATFYYDAIQGWLARHHDDIELLGAALRSLLTYAV